MTPKIEIGAGLDTSVLVRLLTGAPEPQAGAAKEFLSEMEESGLRNFREGRDSAFGFSSIGRMNDEVLIARGEL